MNFLRRHFPNLFPTYERLEPLDSLDDRLDFACMQLVMVQENTGRVTQGDVRKAARDWADEDNQEQYTWLQCNLLEMVTE